MSRSSLEVCVRTLGVVFAWGMTVAVRSPAIAGDWSARVAQSSGEPWREIWGGGEATGQTWSVYSGITVALGGAIRDDGWRFRSVAGYGRYHYQGYKYVGGHPIALTSIQGTSHFTDLLLGYQAAFGRLTVKAFAGVGMDGHRLSPDDPTNASRGMVYGATAALELWLDVSDAVWLSVDQSYTSAHHTFGTRVRAGYRVIPALSMGPEVGARGTRATQDVRAGGFLRYEWDGGEASVSGGITGDIANPATPYAGINLMLRY